MAGQMSRRGQRVQDLGRALPRPDMILAPMRQRLDLVDERLPGALRSAVQTRQVGLARVAGGLRSSALTAQVDRHRQTLTRLTDAMPGRMADRLARLSDRLAATDRVRETLGYKETLKRGYAVVRVDGDVTTAKKGFPSGAVEIEFADGRVDLSGKSTAKKIKPKPQDPEQGSLL